MLPTRRCVADVEAVIFDIDGTLVDSNDQHVEAWHEAFQRYGLPIPRDEIRLQIGKGADMLVPGLIPRVHAKDLTRITKWHDEIFRADYRARIRIFDGAAELIDRLKRSGRDVALVSSSASEDVDYWVEALDAKDKLRAVVSGDDARHSKPAADLFARALSSLAPLSVEQLLSVGDTPYDVLAAAKCRIRTVTVQSGGRSKADLIAAGAVAVFESVSDPAFLTYLSL